MIKMRVRNLDRVKQMIDSLPRETRGLATRESAKYLLGNERRGLQYYPPQAPQVNYRRTFNYRFGWQVNDWGAGTKITILNSVPYAPFVRTRWAPRPWNWRTIEQVIASNLDGMMKAVNDAIQRWIKANEVN